MANPGKDIIDLIGDNLVFEAPSGRGARGSKTAQPVAYTIVRSLTTEDIPAILAPEPLGIGTSPVAQMRHSHHYLARLLAEGVVQGEASTMTGYSLSRISILKADPAFRELVEYYRTQTVAAYVNVHERLGAFALSVVDELQERLEQSPGEFSIRELKEVAEMAMDRSIAPAKGGPKAQGQGGQGGTVTVNVSFAELPPQGQILQIEPKKS